MTEFSDEQMAALATLTLLHPLGVQVDPDDVETCESLAAGGHARRVEGDDFEGSATCSRMRWPRRTGRWSATGPTRRG